MTPTIWGTLNRQTQIAGGQDTEDQREGGMENQCLMMEEGEDNGCKAASVH